MFENAIGLKQKYRSGAQIVGVSMPPDTTADRFEKILDQDDYDYVSVDSQHTPFNEERLAAFCEIAAERDVFVQFRIKHTRNAYLIGNYLDLGPCGVEVPQTETDETAKEAVDSFYYPPAGVRSFGGRYRRGTAGKSVDEYGAWWNSFGVLWLQMESVEAITKGHLLARPGVDGLSIGPADLTVSIKSHPNHWLKTVDDCIAYLCKSLEGTGVAVCHRNYKPELRSKYADMGVQVFLESPQV
ncbi:MAG: 2-keto-3-deoxy-L-rhamnonate aldolase RhmA [Candidatus Latescibacterota bacterium]|jgi:2-keto-3-deoxy-L-rhamnonate aldolase RhmA